MKIGFTGTRDGLTTDQKTILSIWIKTLLNLKANEAHHGDCVGGDASFHDIAEGHNLRIIGHPPNNPKYRAFKECQELRREKEYLERNHDIVDECQWLLACPKEQEEQLRSGTWATIRFARKVGKPLTIIYPDGSYTIEKNKQSD